MTVLFVSSQTAFLPKQSVGICGLQERNYGSGGQFSEDAKNC